MSHIPFLEALSVSKLYKGDQPSGLKATTLSIQQGKITAIIGESGSGKSTLLKLLYGLISPDEGEVHFKGEKIIGPEEKLIPGHDAMKMVTQDTDGLNEFAKVWDNVAILMPNTDTITKEVRTQMVLEQLNIFHLSDRQAYYLSGGEKQRVAIARALITRPEILLLDEPFNQVDTSFRESLQQDIREIVHYTGLTVIMVSHDPAEVLSMADELVVLKDGEILESGPPKLLYRLPKHLYTARILSNCNVLTREQAADLGCITYAGTVVVYPEWFVITTNRTQTYWTIKQVLFKGSYEDLLVEKDNLVVRVLNNSLDRYKAGDKVHLKIMRHLEY